MAIVNAHLDDYINVTRLHADAMENVQSDRDVGRLVQTIASPMLASFLPSTFRASSSPLAEDLA